MAGAGRLPRLALLCLLLCTATAWADGLPRLAVVIDDLGNRWARDVRAVALPGVYSFALLPHTPYARALAWRIRAQGKEVLLHLPMEPRGDQRPGPGALWMVQTRPRLLATLRADLAAVPFVSGVSNHMGSRLTESPRAMAWVMAELARRPGLYFLDSRTSAASRAFAVARRSGLPSLARDVFLDHERDPEAVRRQLMRAVERARERGQAVAIGHPYAVTLEVLEYWLPRLDGRRVRLVPARDLAFQRVRSPEPWPTSSSPSPRVVKNWKPSPSSTCCDVPGWR